MTSSSTPEAAADALCMECGLCCDGTFFGSVVVVHEEREALGRVGLRVVEQDGGLVIAQRCTALQGCLCAVYADRPASCMRYECSLRKSLIAGSTSAEEAQRALARMRSLLATIRDVFGIPVTKSVWEAIVALEEPQTAEDASAAERKYGAGIDAVTELLTLGRSAFEPSFAGGG